MNTPPLLRDLPSQFEPLSPFLESNLQPYIKIHVEEEVKWLESDWNGDPLEFCQSKVGGHPYLPKGTRYPSDRQTNEMMMFLMQVNCADLPIIDRFPLPRQGILQFYSGLNVSMCTLSPERHRILYFPEIIQDTNELVTDFSFLADSASDWEGYECIYPLTFSAQHDVFWSSREQLDEPLEIPDELAQLGEEFDEWIADYEFDQVRQRENKLGGYVELHSEVGEVLEGAKGRLLLEFNHEFNSDDHFYFFIEDIDLANLDFRIVD
ncbi:DUF1963 domain-containing protein [Oculatella sp. LEGE 06141]|uniref:DUF1963 domain-containing protein n=1 Tax=Oculatella sp. LEGE 06141 TaxID=1828648 RepID=UPI00187F2725|nr:YwqG family protein [Oculatella sp. LEGE 06141]MBE9182976.1 DUF1963 domain-containing protein [Oculatella sp. LEGE 06141]